MWNLVRSLVGVGLAHCWVLKDQAGPGSVCECSWLGLGGAESSGPPSSLMRCVLCGWVLVGLLFEICIVDASIFHAMRSFEGVV